jgi:hypothetical protein
MKRQDEFDTLSRREAKHAVAKRDRLAGEECRKAEQAALLAGG